MNIINFTPLSAFAGGIIIGLAVVVFFVGNGRLAGISSITDNLLTSKQGRGDNFFFLIGLVVGPIIFLFFNTNEIPFLITNSLPLIIAWWATSWNWNKSSKRMYEWTWNLWRCSFIIKICNCHFIIYCYSNSYGCNNWDKIKCLK